MAGLTPSDYEKKSFLLGQSFNPSAPIRREDLFAGRQSQIRDVVDAINQPGQHAVLYGERGVGKTSLANMIFSKLDNPAGEVLAPQINCMTQDSFSDIWRRVFEEIDFNSKNGNEDEPLVEKRTKRILKAYTAQYADAITPDIVRRVLYNLGQESVVVIILDEYDTVISDEARSTMSDTLKFLSDRSVPATVVLIGVANDVETLIRNHRSLERCLKQILMPRMSDREVETIVVQGLAKAKMSINKGSLEEISRITRGLPHYGHLLGLHAGRAALDQKSLSVSEKNVQTAVHESINKTQATIQTDYSKAITSSRKEALFKEVILACAIAETDDVGWFYPKDVRSPLQRILGRPYKIEAFARHLHAFCEDNRGPVLIKDESSARPRFRFDNPLMQPYVLIRGLAEQRITVEDLLKLREDPRQKSML